MVDLYRFFVPNINRVLKTNLIQGTWLDYCISHVAENYSAYFSYPWPNTNYRHCWSRYLVSPDWVYRVYDGNWDWHGYMNSNGDASGAILLPRNIVFGQTYKYGQGIPVQRLVREGFSDCRVGEWKNYNPAITCYHWFDFNVCGFMLPAIYIKEEGGPQIEEYILVQDVGLVWYKNPNLEITWNICEGVDGQLITCLGIF